jgi:hypothetical protein
VHVCALRNVFLSRPPPLSPSGPERRPNIVRASNRSIDLPQSLQAAERACIDRPLFLSLSPDGAGGPNSCLVAVTGLACARASRHGRPCTVTSSTWSMAVTRLQKEGAGERDHGLSVGAVRSSRAWGLRPERNNDRRSRTRQCNLCTIASWTTYVVRCDDEQSGDRSNDWSIFYRSRDMW